MEGGPHAKMEDFSFLQWGGGKDKDLIPHW